MIVTKSFRFLAAPSQWLQTVGLSTIARRQIARTDDHLGRLEDRISTSDLRFDGTRNEIALV